MARFQGVPDGIASRLEPHPDAFLWLHFSISNKATERWFRSHLDLPEIFYDGLHQEPCSTRVEQDGESRLAVGSVGHGVLLLVLPGRISGRNPSTRVQGKIRLRILWPRFKPVVISAYGSFANPGFIRDFFGRMREDPIGRFACKHADHHLRQLGC